MAKKSLSSQEFLQKCIKIHGDRYDYTETEFISTREKVKIKCKIHGIFEQRASAHLENAGCPKCRNQSVRERFVYTKETFMKSLNDYHLKNLKFDDFQYVNDKTKGKIYCNIHDISFLMTPSNLKKSPYGCPKCVKEYHKSLVRNTKDDFINLSLKKHGDIFDYSLLPESFHSHDYIKIKCKECNSIFERVAYSHCNIGHSCPKCSASKTHKLLEEFLEQLHIQFKRNDRTILNGKEIDLLILNKNIGIECNGNYWHSEELLKDCDYHLNKTRECEKKNIQLLHFFEDELLFKFDIVKSIIQQKLKICNNRIYARKCQIKNVDVFEKNDFLNHNHIQGEDQSKIKLGLYYDNELVSLMTFGSPRYNKKVEYELIRFCNKKFTNVVGGASKLFNYFIKMYNPNNIISYADKRISNGHLYHTLKFNYSHDSDPRYFYFPKRNPLQRMHRSNFTKDKIKNKFPDADLNKTEKEIMLSLGYLRIWDCGTKVYIWNKN
jgi:hypothetical protein